MSLPLTGTCNCGAVSFEVTEPLVGASYCHCTRCQRRTGAGASPNGRVAADAFRIVRGEDRIRSWKPPQGAEKFFCGDCGSALFSRTSEGRVGVRLGVLDSDPGISPSAHQFTAYAASWEAIPDDGLPRHLEGAPPPP
jgi:hypothetical protein